MSRSHRPPYFAPGVVERHRRPAWRLSPPGRHLLRALARLALLMAAMALLWSWL